MSNLTYALSIALAGALSLSGYFLGQSNNEIVYVQEQQTLGATVVFTGQGGTGTSSIPVAGDILMSQAAGSYGPAAVLQGANITLSTSTIVGGLRTLTITASAGTGAPFAWTPESIFGVNTNATTSALRVGGMFLTSTSSIGQLNVGELFATSTSNTSTFATPPTFSTLTSALILTGAGGLTAEYTGTSACAGNQAITLFSALGVETCGTFNNWAYPFIGAATSTLLTFSGGLDASGGTATFGTLAGALDAGGATSLEIPNADAPTVNVTGEIALDTSSGNVIVATTTTNHFVVGSASTTLYSFVIASTSPDFRSGGVINLPESDLPQTITGIRCHVDAGTSVVINLDDGTNNTNAPTCTTTRIYYPINTNASFTAAEAIRLEFGTVTGAVDYLVVRVYGYKTTD